jgi:hypothetical protein
VIDAQEPAGPAIVAIALVVLLAAIVTAVSLIATFRP